MRQPAPFPWVGLLLCLTLMAVILYVVVTAATRLLEFFMR